MFPVAAIGGSRGRTWLGEERDHERPFRLEKAKVVERRLTLFDGAHGVGFELVVGLEHVGEAQAGELGSSLAAMPVEDREAAIVACSLEVLLGQELRKTIEEVS